MNYLYDASIVDSFDIFQRDLERMDSYINEFNHDLGEKLFQQLKDGFLDTIICNHGEGSWRGMDTILVLLVLKCKIDARAVTG